MATKIQWTGETWNPTLGCSKVSPGCANCYAVNSAHRNLAMGQTVYEGLTERHGNGMLDWTGVVRTVPERLQIPLRKKKPTMYFVDSMSDLFHEDVPEAFLDGVFEVMENCPQHIFQILTKRPERMAMYLGWRWGQGRIPSRHIWIGVSVEDQQRADERIPLLLITPAQVRFLSCEPLLGELRLCPWLKVYGHIGVPCHVQREGFHRLGESIGKTHESGIHWVIVGGESGSNARRFDLSWGRSIVEQCQTAGVPVFVKQLGADPWDENGMPYDAVKDRKGGDMEEWPADLRVREFPAQIAVAR